MDKSHEVLVYNSFNMLLNLVCLYSFENLEYIFIMDIDLQFSFLQLSLSGFVIMVMLASKELIVNYWLPGI